MFYSVLVSSALSTKKSQLKIWKDYLQSNFRGENSVTNIFYRHKICQEVEDMTDSVRKVLTNKKYLPAKSFIDEVFTFEVSHSSWFEHVPVN